MDAQTITANDAGPIGPIGTTRVPLDQLGRDIVARVAQGDKAKDRSEQLYKSAGLQLIEARKQVPDFSAFLSTHCDGLGRSRAYELIAIAEGRADEVRQKNRARDRRRRAKAAGVREPRTRTAAAPVPTKSVSEKALAEFKFAVDHWFARMDFATTREAIAYVEKKASSQ